jgi:hypothetical protein
MKGKKNKELQNLAIFFFLKDKEMKPLIKKKLK